MNTAETIIDLYKKAEKTEEYKSQLEKIYEICKGRQDDIIFTVSKGHSNQLVIKSVCETNSEYIILAEILREINI